MDKTKQIGKKVPLFALLAVLILTMTNQRCRPPQSEIVHREYPAVVSFKAGD